MKKFILIATALLLTAFTVVITGEEWLLKLQTNSTLVKKQVVEDLYGGVLNTYFDGGATKQAWFKLTDAQKKDAVLAVGAFIKNFCTSDAGQKAVLAFAKDKKLEVGAGDKPDSSAERFKEEKQKSYDALMGNNIADDTRFAMLTGTITGTESLLAFKSDENEKIKIQASLDKYKKLLALYDSKSPTFKKEFARIMSDDVARRAYETEIDQYNQSVIDNANYFKELDAKEHIPQTDRIKVVLHSFLDNTEDVDYSAQLTGTGRQKRFVNQDYEAKPAMWKMLYRAGKVPGEAARAFAEQWMNALK